MAVSKSTDNTEENNKQKPEVNEEGKAPETNEDNKGTDGESQGPVVPEKVEITVSDKDKKKPEAQDLTPEIMGFIQDQMAKFIAAQGPRVPGDRPIKEIYQEAELPVDDYLKDPVIFFAFSKYYAIWGDKRKGQQVSTPYERKIEFDTVYRFTRAGKTERGIEIVTISQAVVRSKKEVEFLENHTLYGIKFFKNMKDAQSVDVTLSEKMAEAQGMIGGMDDMKVINRAQNEGVNIENPDVSKIRQQLIQKLAFDAMELETKRTKQTLEEHNQKDAKNAEKKKVEEAGAAQDVY